jgi:hypothetical protein
MEKIIIVGDYNRDDFLYVGKLMQGSYAIYFLDHLSEKEITSFNYKKWGKALFWKDYKDALDLIDTVNPTKVLFYFIESFNHVALNVACKCKGIKTFHLEHGIRNYEVLEKFIKDSHLPVKESLLSKFKKLTNIKSRLESRYFFLNTVSKLPEEKAGFLKDYFKIRSNNSVFQTFRLVNSTLRLADCYISFSKKIFEFHRQSDHLPENYPVRFIGCPAFDYLSEYAHLQKHGDDILFIDNAFETQNLFGWNNENKIRFLDELVTFASRQQRQLWIKIHPYSNMAAYQNCKENANVHIINDEKDFKESILSTHVVIGFYSTLLMPLMALDHTVCFSLEMHPERLDYKLSSFLVNTGAIKGIDSWDELQLEFNDLQKNFAEQEKNKQSFVDQWMYKFDGRASERLKNILLDEVF